MGQSGNADELRVYLLRTGVQDLCAAADAWTSVACGDSVTAVMSVCLSVCLYFCKEPEAQNTPNRVFGVFFLHRTTHDRNQK